MALVCILFDGGHAHRLAAVPVGRRPDRRRRRGGNVPDRGGRRAARHVAFGLGWYVALLVATAVAPTDPAVVFSVLGRREIAGRSATILEGESGANDPVGIALMAGLITAGGLQRARSPTSPASSCSRWPSARRSASRVAGLLWFMRRVPLPGEGLYPLRTLACALLLFAVATLAHGSGFLAVFVAGIVLGDERAPYKREIERFHAALASLARSSRSSSSA